MDANLESLNELLAAGTDAATKAVQDADLEGVFAAGYRMGVMAGIGLASAYAIKEQRLRDQRRAAGQGELYKRHDSRAQAFNEVAGALTRWSERHG